MRATGFVIASVMIAVAALIAVPSSPSTMAVTDLQQTEVFLSGTEGYHTFRIPGIVITPKGHLLAFCEGRRQGRGDSGDIDLVLRRSEDSGRTWGPLEVLWDDGQNTCGNPCPVVDRSNGTIWLPLTWNHGQDNERDIKAGTGRDTRRVYITHSTDDGRTWAAPREITDSCKLSDWRWYATGPGVGIQLERGRPAGRLVIPCDHSTPAGEYRAHVIYSDDHGRSWKLGGTIKPEVNECQAVELIDGSVMINLRNYSQAAPRQRARSYSYDGGATWSEVEYDADLVEPVCQASLLRYAWTPDRLLFANPASTTRQRMTIRQSDDGGKSWRLNRVLHEGPAAYSCLVALPDGSIGCLYERGDQSPNERITFARWKD